MTHADWRWRWLWWMARQDYTTGRWLVPFARPWWRSLFDCQVTRFFRVLQLLGVWDTLEGCFLSSGWLTVPWRSRYYFGKRVAIGRQLWWERDPNMLHTGNGAPPAWLGYEKQSYLDLAAGDIWGPKTRGEGWGDGPTASLYPAPPEVP